MGLNINTRALAQEITRHAPVSRSVAELVIAGMAKAVPEIMERGGWGTTVKVGTLGEFRTKRTAPRTATLLSGETRKLPAKISATFKKGTALKKAEIAYK